MSLMLGTVSGIIARYFGVLDRAPPGASGRIQGPFQVFPVRVMSCAVSGITAKCFGVLDRAPPGASGRLQGPFPGISGAADAGYSIWHHS